MQRAGCRTELLQQERLGELLRRELQRVPLRLEWVRPVLDPRRLALRWFRRWELGSPLQQPGQPHAALPARGRRRSGKIGKPERLTAS